MGLARLNIFSLAWRGAWHASIILPEHAFYSWFPFLSDNVVKCHTCQQECNIDDVITNEFVPPSETASDASKNSEDSAKLCTACEENADATSYCIDCGEYLCDQCVNAHKRVRITKDHTIQPKDEVSKTDDSAANLEKVLHCPVHKNELLKLYCDTCDKLTCRDCQLQEHKEHR